MAANDSSGAPPLFTERHALCQAASSGESAKLKHLLTSLPQEEVQRICKQPDSDGRTLLHTAVASHVDNDVLSMIQHCTVQSSDEAGWTPLHSAVSAGNFAGVEWLLEQGAQVGAATTDGRQPLHYAKTRTDIAELLLEHGANVQATDNSGCTALHRAAGRGATAMVQYLHEHGADLNALDRAGETPAHHAAAGGCVDAFIGLAEAGADLTIRSRRNETVLDVGDTACANALRELAKSRTAMQ